MSNVLADDKHDQIVALGRLGWSLRRIERTTGVRRETISGYLKAVGIVVPGRGRRASRAKTRPFPLSRCPPTLVAQIRPFPRRWPRRGTGESGHQGGSVHRLGAASTSGPCAERERVRAVSSADRRGARSGPERHGHLAGPRRRSWLHRSVCERAPLCRDAPRDVVAGGARRDHDRTGRGRPGRLRRGSAIPTRASTGARASSS